MKQQNFIEIEEYVWAGNVIEEGEYISDGRLLFRQQDIENQVLLKAIGEINVLYLSPKPQKAADKTFKILRKAARRILEYNKIIPYKLNKSGGMVFLDCFGDEWKVQRGYYKLAKRLLKFDFLLGLKDCVVFVKNSEIIGCLMCFSN